MFKLKMSNWYVTIVSNRRQTEKSEKSNDNIYLVCAVINMFLDKKVPSMLKTENWKVEFPFKLNRFLSLPLYI